MQWSVFLDSLDSERRAVLTNALTTGWGYAGLAARLIAADRATGVILSHLNRTAASLITVQSLLPPEFRTWTFAPGIDDVFEFAGNSSWQEFLAGLKSENA